MRAVVVWPPHECERKEAHEVPLDAEGLAIVERLMAAATPGARTSSMVPAAPPALSPRKSTAASATSKITGHTTAHVFRHYDIGEVEKLRERLAESRSYAKRLPTASKVTPLRPRSGSSEEQRVAR